MIKREMLFTLIPGLREEDLEQWITRAWVRPDRRENEVTFAEIDVARVRLLVSLQVELQIDTGAVPVVLSLLDQLHDARRQLRVVRRAIDTTASEDLRRRIAEQMRRLTTG